MAKARRLEATMDAIALATADGMMQEAKGLTRGPAQAGSYPFISPIQLISEFPRAARGNGRHISPIRIKFEKTS